MDLLEFYPNQIKKYASIVAMTAVKKPERIFTVSLSMKEIPSFLTVGVEQCSLFSVIAPQTVQVYFT